MYRAAVITSQGLLRYVEEPGTQRLVDFLNRDKAFKFNAETTALMDARRAAYAMGLEPEQGKNYSAVKV